MRGLLPGLPSPHPLAPALPNVFETDPPLSEPGAGDGPAGLRLLPAVYTTTIDPRDIDSESAPPEPSLPAEQLVGDWVLQLEGEVAGREHAFSLTRDGNDVLTGQFRYVGTGVAVTSPSCGTVEGTYTWRLDGDCLSFAAVDDQCSSRRVLLTLHPWRRRSFVTRFVSAFDGALAPVFSTLDNIDAYVDPRLTPSDFVDWLAGWVGLSPTQKWPLPRRRERIARAVQLARWWGTVEGLAEVVAVFTGIDRSQVDIIEHGGVEASEAYGGSLPGTHEPHLKVRVRVSDPAAFDLEELDRLVAGAKPAHLTHEVEAVAE